MKIYDISMWIHNDMQVYKNKADKRPVLRVVRDFSTGGVYESAIQMDMHTGTHIDAPLHVIENARTVDAVDLYRLVTKCRVLDLTALSGAITKSDLTGLDISEEDFLLLKTKNSYTGRFADDFVYLAESGARYLVSRKIAGVGIDSLGIERNQSGHPTHKLLLGAEITVLEGLCLADIKAGEYVLIALPLKIRGAEASPARAILLEDFP